jgi:hypothetical protein
MVDLLRSYRRWLLGRLALLVPAFATALFANLWIAFATNIERWLKVISLVLSGLSLATLGYLLSETLTCSVLQRRGNRGLARTLRGQLAYSGGVAAVCLIVLLVIIGAPFFVRLPDAAKPPTSHLRHPWVEPAPVEFTQVVVENPPPALAAPADPAPPKPEIRPVIADVPVRLEAEEKELEAPLALAPFLQEAPPKRAVEEPPAAEALRFRPEPLPAPAPDPYAPGGVDRLGARGEEEAAAPPPSFRLELLLLTMESRGRGPGADLEADVPLSRASSLRAGYLGVAFGSGDEVDEVDARWTWHRLSLGYLHRLLGYTRHAGVDLAVSAGMTVDRFEDEGTLDTSARISPYVAADLGLWQGGGWGFTVHARQGLPVNLLGASSLVTDVAAVFRLDLSERISLSAGYRVVLLKLKEFAENLEREHGDEEFDARLAGPLLGLECRF